MNDSGDQIGEDFFFESLQGSPATSTISEISENLDETNLAVNGDEVSDEIDLNFNYFPDAQIGRHHIERTFGKHKIAENGENSKSLNERNSPANDGEKSGQITIHDTFLLNLPDKFSQVLTNFPTNDEELEAFKSEKVSELTVKDVVSKKPPIRLKTRKVCTCGPLGPRYVKECRCKSKKNYV